MKPRSLIQSSPQEQRGTLVLAAIVVLAIVVNQTLPVLFFKELSPNDSLRAELIAYHNKLQTEESQQTEVHPFSPFSPNLITKTELVEIGIPKKLASTWSNYLEAGGRFENPHDLLKLYGMDSALFQVVEPYLVFDTFEVGTSQKEIHSYKQHKSTRAELQIRLEINSADSSDWVALPGIGPGYSKRIMKYRSILGGYYSEDQLLEVWGIDTMTILGLMPVFEVDTGLIVQLNLNEIGLYKLKSHPYITMELANQIIKSRYYDGDFESEKDLISRGIVNREYYPKIAPYISVN